MTRSQVREDELVAFKHDLKDILRECLSLKMDTRCRGHMGPSEDFLVVLFDGDPVAEVKVGEDYYDEQYQQWRRR